MLISGWLNSLMMTLVSLLILFRSLDGSSPLVDRLRRVLPFVPFPPSLERRGNGTSVGSVSTNPGGPPRHHYNSEKTVIVCEERPVFENKIIVEEDEEGEGEGSEEDVEQTWTERGGSSSKGYSFNASTVRPLVRVPPRSASLSYPSTSTSSSRSEKTISRVPVPTLGSSDRPTTTLRRQGSTFSQASTYSPPPPEYRRESNAHSIELEDDDSAVDKDGGGGQGTSKG